MTLIKNNFFKKIFENSSEKQTEKYDPVNLPYLGMGNPDATILFVGSEKSIDPSAKIGSVIDKHERINNFAHWFDIVTNNNNKSDYFHPYLKLRNGSLKGFNPFSPITLDETMNDVYSKGGHTYKKIEKIINAILLTYKSITTVSLFEITPKQYTKSTFNYCFLTELSDLPKKSQGSGEKWTYNNFCDTERYKQIYNGVIGKFYRNFKTVVIYAGGHYITDKSREPIIQLFNPTLTLQNRNPNFDNYNFVDVYQNKKGAKVVICNHLVDSYTDWELQHILSVLAIGNIE